MFSCIFYLWWPTMNPFQRKMTVQLSRFKSPLHPHIPPHVSYWLRSDKVCNKISLLYSLFAIHDYYDCLMRLDISSAECREETSSPRQTMIIISMYNFCRSNSKLGTVSAVGRRCTLGIIILSWTLTTFSAPRRSSVAVVKLLVSKTADVNKKTAGPQWAGGCASSGVLMDALATRTQRLYCSILS